MSHRYTLLESGRGGRPGQTVVELGGGGGGGLEGALPPL